MRISRLAVLGAFLMFVKVGAASASSISFTDTFDPADVLITGAVGTSCDSVNGASDTVTPGSTCNSLMWTHVLAGFNSVTDTLTSATATLTVHDNEAGSPGQNFDIKLDLLTFSGQVVTDGAAPTVFTYNVLSQLSDGQLGVLITSQNGNHDFIFDSAVLNAAGTRVDAVPEPASLGLLGMGLLAGARRFRKKKSLELA